MSVYVYQAALLCEECATIVNTELGDLWRTTYDDSQQTPQGPYPEGGGESDTPNHCDRCRVFLENPLTSDGEAYVRDAYFRGKLGEGNPTVTQEWREFYSYAFSCFE